MNSVKTNQYLPKPENLISKYTSFEHHYTNAMSFWNHHISNEQRQNKQIESWGNW